MAGEEKKNGLYIKREEYLLRVCGAWGGGGGGGGGGEQHNCI